MGFVTIPQFEPKAITPSFDTKCIQNTSLVGLFRPIVLGKITDLAEASISIKPYYKAIRFLVENLGNAAVQAKFKSFMGETWFAKFKKNVSTAAKNTGKAIADGAEKIAGSLKIKAKAPATPKVKVHVKAKAAPKAKVSLKAGAKAAPKAKVSVKAGAKKRRLQAPKKPAPAADPKKPAADPKKPEDKKSEEKKPQNGAIVEFAYAPTGLDLNEYAKDVTVPDKLSRGTDQSNPLSSNLLKLAFMTFAILLTMF